MTISDVDRYFSFLLCEQDVSSPHKYLDQNILNKHYDIIIDGGGAEGYFTIITYNTTTEFYIFECDEEWAEALTKTFKDSANVHVIKKALGQCNKEDRVSIDSLNIKSNNILIKLDVEGDELKCLYGAVKTITNHKPDILTCVYHYQNEELDIRNYFCNLSTQLNGVYSYEIRPGYMFFPHISKIKKPYLRRGVVKYFCE